MTSVETPRDANRQSVDGIAIERRLSHVAAIAEDASMTEPNAPMQALSLTFIVCSSAGPEDRPYASAERGLVSWLADYERPLCPKQRCAIVRAGPRNPGAIAAIAPDTLLDPASVGETYWQLHCQPRDAWTHELDLRPFGETW